LTLRARWVFPVDGPPLEQGVVEIAGGRITAVHNRPGPCTHELGNSAMIPGLVNAHTHLELSDVQRPLQPAQPFTAWLRAVMAHRRDRTSKGNTPGAANARSVAAGLAESAASGTTLLGDIAGPDWQPSARHGAVPRCVSFLELLGLAPERRSKELERARGHLVGREGAIRGLSPHAPYSVHPDLFRNLIDLAAEQRAPVAMHLAETKCELELLASGSGEFLPFLEELGVWRSDAIPRGTRPLDYLRELARVETGLVIHGNYLADHEVNFLARSPNLSVVYCPRTHAYFGHEPHPWRRLIAHGVNVAIGTDSRASNPDLSVWNELLYLRRLAPDLDPAVLLELGTTNSARALGLSDDTGTLTAGKSADLAVVEIAPDGASDPWTALFHPGNRISAVLCAGEWSR
jgi:cytosine/adenosine deaminase-related metal-dependent hydrolase